MSEHEHPVGDIEPRSEQPELKLEGRAWELPSDLKVLKFVRDEVESRLTATGWDELDINMILMGVDEAVTNAIVHGNLGVGGEQTFADHTAFRAAIAAASATDLGKRTVHMTVDVDSNLVRIGVGDEGNGFDVKKIRNPLENENLEQQGGRGVFLMRSAFDIVGYNEKGNQVWMEKRREVSK